MVTIPEVNLQKGKQNSWTVEIWIVDELQFKLAEEIYDSIRDCDTVICDISENLGFKGDNIKNVKDHVF